MEITCHRLYVFWFAFVVKAVLGSGSSAWASSNGFYIDISPPEFDPQVMFYVDVSQGEDLPAELQAQGSNDTIKAVWLCEDKQSEIAVGCLHFEIDLLERYACDEKLLPTTYALSLLINSFPTSGLC